MAFNTNPVDYSGMLGLNPATDPRILRQNQQQIDLQRQQVMQRQQAAQAQAQQQQAYEAAVQEYIAAPPDQRVALGAALQMRFPEQASAIKGAFEQQDKAAQDTDFKTMTRFYGLLGAGRADTVKTELQQRIEAGRAAGIDVADDEELLAQITADPNKAQGFIGHLMASIGGAEKFAGIEEQLRLGQPGSKLREVAPGAVIIDEGEIDPETGRPKVLFENPLKPEIVGNAESGYSIVRPGTVSGNGTPGAGRYKNGWAPRARNGGDNSDASVDNYIAHVAGKLGIGPDTPISEAQLGALAAGMAEFESGGNPNALSVRNNNPGNIRKNGEFVKYPSLAAGQAAQRDLLRRYFGRGQNTVRSIIEGVPVAGGSANAGGASVTPIIAGAGAKQTRIMTPEEVSAIPGLDPGSVYQVKPDGTITAVANSRPQLKPPPQPVMTAYTENRRSLRKIDQAIAAVRGAKNATGWKGYLPDAVLQRTDPNGVKARALVADIGSLKIHDRSGANVTASESPRLLPFIPSVSDSAETIVQKLNQFQEELRGIQSDIEGIYSEDQGYRFPRLDTPQRAAPARNAHPADITAIMRKYGAR